jgi:hypothetical protein
MSLEQKIVACLGSSSTAGKGQAFDWIAELRRRPRNGRFEFRNFGVGGDLAYNALQRLPDVVACRPTRLSFGLAAMTFSPSCQARHGVSSLYRSASHVVRHQTGIAKTSSK